MRDLLISLGIVGLLLGVWITFSCYSESQVEDLSQFIDTDIMSAVEDSDWKDANAKILTLKESWKQYRKSALFFLDTQTINEIDCSLAKAVKYAKAEDVSNASGEFHALARQLEFLSTGEAVTWGNIF